MYFLIKKEVMGSDLNEVVSAPFVALSPLIHNIDKYTHVVHIMAAVGNPQLVGSLYATFLYCRTDNVVGRDGT